MRIIELVGVVAALSACSGSNDAAQGAPATVIVFKPGADALPAYGDVPFPSDLYRDADGRVSGQIQGFERVTSLHTEVFQSAFGTLDGFGRATASVFFTNAEVDASSLDADGAVLLVDVDPASPDRGTSYPVGARWLPSLSCISVLPRPGTVLAPGVRYATVVTTRVADAKGRALRADTALGAIEGLAGAARKSAAETLYGDALDALRESGAIASARDVAGLAVFTTTRMVFELAALRDRLRAEFPAPGLLVDATGAAPYHAAIFGVASTPDLDAWLGTPDKDDTGKEWPGVDNPGGPAHDQIGVVASGAIVSPAFADPDTHHIEHAADGSAIVADPAAKIPVTLMIPKAPPASAAGYPVVIYGHGLQADRSGMFAFANEYARAGFAVAAIDDVGHGLRTGGIPDNVNNFKGPYVGPDGLPDHPGLPLQFFGGFTDFVTIRDSFRQTILDECSLVRMIENPALDLSPLAGALGGATPKLDAAHIYWSGQSLGGMMGTIFTAVEPDLRASAIDVPGGAFVGLIATNSAKLHAVVATLASSTFGIQGDDILDEYHPGVQLMAMATEPGDPIDYAPHVFGASLFDPAPAHRPSLLLSYSVDDEVMPNLATGALIGAFGIPLVEPTIRDVPGVDVVAAPVSGNLDGRTGAAVQYSPSTHALGSNRYDSREYIPGDPQPDPQNRWPTIPHKITVELPIREHIAALLHFFEADLAGSPPEVTVTAPPLDDYDGDGVPDATETANGTDPYDPDSH